MPKFNLARQALLGRISRLSLADPIVTGTLPAAVAPAFLHEQRAVAWRRIVVEAFWMWLATRFFMGAFTLSTVLLRPNARTHGWVAIPLRDLLYAWKRWDGYWYTEIARQGYWGWKPTAFFPLYPSLIRATALVAGEHWLVVALLISNLAALGAFIGLGLLAAQEQGESQASARAIRVFAAYPLAFFLTAPYTEGLFVALAACTLFCARRGMWHWAALLAFFAGLTRPTSVVLLLPLVWEFGQQHGWWHALADDWRGVRTDGVRTTLAAKVRCLRPIGRERHGADVIGWHEAFSLILLLGAIPCAFALYMAYLWYRFGHPLLFLHVQQLFWHRDSLPLWQTSVLAIKQLSKLSYLSYYQVRSLVDYGPIVLFALLTLLLMRRQPFAFTLYMVGLLYLAVASPVLQTSDPDLFQSAGRFMLAAIPIFLVLGCWTRGRPALDLLLVGGGFMLQGVLAAYFLAGGWLI